MARAWCGEGRAPIEAANVIWCAGVEACTGGGIIPAIAEFPE